MEEDIVSSYLSNECVEKKFSKSDKDQTIVDVNLLSSNIKSEKKYNSVNTKVEFTELSPSIKSNDSLSSAKELIFDVSLSEKLKCKITNDTNIRHSCVICSKKTYSYACQPCGHLCLCDNCCVNVVKKKCPLCCKQVIWMQEIILPYSL